jgi:hypothetical protein
MESVPTVGEPPTIGKQDYMTFHPITKTDHNQNGPLQNGLH